MGRAACPSLLFSSCSSWAFVHFRRPCLLGQPGTKNDLAGPSRSQLICCKSIDKLISDSEEPERRLKKTLGPVSLNALGIGAVIGAGIFTVIGTAIGGNPAKIADWKGSPILDLVMGWIHHTNGAVAGRPGAGPALALWLGWGGFAGGRTGCGVG